MFEIKNIIICDKKYYKYKYKLLINLARLDQIILPTTIISKNHFQLAIWSGTFMGSSLPISIIQEVMELVSRFMHY